MSLSFWISLWKAVLVLGIGLFAILAVVVTIGGFKDVMRLLQRLREQAQEPDDPLR